MQRPKCSIRGITFLHKYDEVGFPCKKTIGLPEPLSTHAIFRPYIVAKFLFVVGILFPGEGWFTLFYKCVYTFLSVVRLCKVADYPGFSVHLGLKSTIPCFL